MLKNLENLYGNIEELAKPRRTLYWAGGTRKIGRVVPLAEPAGKRARCEVVLADNQGGCAGAVRAW